MPYVPSREILEKYATILVRFALNNGEGVRPGQSVRVNIPEVAKPLYVPLRNALLEAGAHPLMQYSPDGVEAAGYYERASDVQLQFTPIAFWNGLVEQYDHTISIIAEADKYELKGVDPSKLMLQQASRKPLQDMFRDKEEQGLYTWTLALYGTEAMASDVGMTLEEYWQQIIAACYLDQADPVQAWKQVFKELEEIRQHLNALPIEWVHVTGEDVDLRIRLGANRQWLGGSGRNIPSFELFTSPDCREAEGWIRFNQPLYRYGNRMSGIYLEFKHGRVVKITAEEGEELLKEMIGTAGADRMGEFSLTDRRYSKITRRMGETLFDENIGGEYGNTHIALGSAYRDGLRGDISKLTEEDFIAQGLNTSSIHTDIISTAPREVMAVLSDGSSKHIYANGQFLV